MAWMWGAIPVANMAAWLHQLTAITAGEDILAGHGVRGGKAMIAIPARPADRRPGRLTPATWYCGSRPAATCSPRSSPGYGNYQHRPDLRTQSPRSQSLPAADQPRSAGTYPPPRTRRRSPGCQHGQHPEPRSIKIIYEACRVIRGIGSDYRSRGHGQTFQNSPVARRQIMGLGICCSAVPWTLQLPAFFIV